jgi:hypothetical protein
MDRTIIGDVVNISSRIESLTKIYKVDFLVDEAFYSQLSDTRFFRLIAIESLSGREGSSKVYEYYGHVRDDVIAFKDSTKKALKGIIIEGDEQFEERLLLLEGLINACPPHTVQETIMDTTLLVIKEKMLGQIFGGLG